MAENIIKKMAKDLRIKHFQEEAAITYKGRVVYSAMASWIKAIALDQPVGTKEAGFQGVSRRHMHERSQDILAIICKMYPGLDRWFMIPEEDPVNIIRTRLLRHGDLLNEGFNTNIALSYPHTKQIAAGLETVYGSVLGKRLIYAGISIVRKNHVESIDNEMVGIEEWMENFIHDIGWSRAILDTSQLAYFDPFKNTRNNYSAWENHKVKAVNGIFLSRLEMNKNSYEYYIVKEKNNLVSKIDPFLIAEGYHTRLMYALRKKVQNGLTATVDIYEKYVTLHLNAYLPKKETILLESYAWPIESITDKLNWSMLPEIWEVIKPNIESLGIQIKEINNG